MNFNRVKCKKIKCCGKSRQKASYTVEAAIYIPIVLFVLFQSLEIGIDFWQVSKEREINAKVQNLDIVQEFYAYQIMAEIGEEIQND